jgi:hypothetical protein
MDGSHGGMYFVQQFSIPISIKFHPKEKKIKGKWNFPQVSNSRWIMEQR